MHARLWLPRSSGGFAASPPRGPLHRVSASVVHSRRSLRRAPGFGVLVPTSASRSVLVVSHHLDGFLRPCSAGIVAACCRSWGSPCFGQRMACTAPRQREPPAPCGPSPRCNHPPKNLPADSCSRCSPRPPRRVCASRPGHAPVPFTSARAGSASASRRCSVDRSVARQALLPGSGSLCPPMGF
jgi:hypothetical protein